MPKIPESYHKLNLPPDVTDGYVANGTNGTNGVHGASDAIYPHGTNGTNGANDSLSPRRSSEVYPATAAVPDSLRLLLVAPHEEARQAVERALRHWQGEVQLFWAAQPESAPERAHESAPQVILVDDVLYSTALAGLVGKLAAAVPGAVILALVEERNVGEARQAVLAGARGFVTKPLDGDDLATTLRQVLIRRPVTASPQSAQPAAGPALGQVVVFCGPKGGTGRTTMMVNTSVALRARTGQPVVLVDADYSAPALDVALNLRDERDVGDLIPRLNRLDDELLDRVLAVHASGVHVLLAPPPTEHDTRLAPGEVRQIVDFLRRRFAWVVVDLGLPVDDTALTLLDAADRIVVSVLPEMVGLRNTRLLLELLHRRNYPDDKVWMMLNRATLRGGVRRQDIEERLHMRVRHAIPDDQPLASMSVNRGVPLVLSHPRSAVAKAVQAMAAELAAELVPDEVGETARPKGKRGGGPISRLLRRKEG